MITNNGKLHIKRYIAQYVPAIAQSIAFGVGNAAESANDTTLQLQVTQGPVDLPTYDFVNNAVVFKASVPDDYVGSIYEVGLYSLISDPNATNYGSQLITTFDSATEAWVDTTSAAASGFGASNTRVGVDSLIQTPAASTTKTDGLANMTLDLSGYSGNDYFTFAMNVGNAFASNVKFYFLTDASNYFTFTQTTNVQTAGYKMITMPKSTATVTGTPSWSTITEVRASTTSTAGGAASVAFDAIRIEDTDSIDLDYILVARKVLTTPVTKIEGQAQDIEFSLDISI